MCHFNNHPFNLKVFPTYKRKKMIDSATTLVSRWKRPLEVAFWIMLPLIGLAFFAFRNTHESLWADEAYTMGISALNPMELWRAASREVHPPLYYLIVWAFRTLAGSSLRVVRSVSAIGAFGMLMVGAFPLRRLLGRTTAILFILMTASAPLVLAYAQEIRMYSWAAFFVIGMAAYLVLALRDGHRRDWILTFLFTVGSMYTHLFSLMAAAFLGILGLGYLIIKARDQLRPYLLNFGLASVLFLPWLSTILAQASNVKKSYWIPQLTADSILSAFDFPYGLKFSDTPNAIYIAFIVAGVILAGLVFAILRRKETAPAVIFLLAYLAVFGAAIGISLAITPILVNRYLLPIIGLWMAAAAYALSQFRREIIVVAMVALFLVNRPALQSIYLDRYNGPMQEVASFLAPQLQPGDIILHTDEHTTATFAYYFPKNTQVVFLPAGSVIYTDLTIFPNVEIVTDLQSVIARGNRIWLATWIYNRNQDAYRMAVRKLGLSEMPDLINKENPTLPKNGSVKFFVVSVSWYSIILGHTP
jgi:uncharacterized membrane protein